MKVTATERAIGWQNITNAIRKTRDIFDMALHDDLLDENSHKKVWQLLVTAQEIANIESTYCQMKDYNGCFIPSLRKIFAKIKI